MTRSTNNDISDFKFPFEDHVPKEFKRDQVQDISQDYTGETIIHISNYPFYEGEYISEENGIIFKYGKRRAYRFRNWTNSLHTHKWIIYSEISGRWILLTHHNEKNPEYIDNKPKEYFCEEGKVIGKYINGIYIKKDKVYGPREIYKNDINASTPVGNWYTNSEKSLLDQKNSPSIQVVAGEISKKNLIKLKDDTFLSQRFINIGKYYLDIKEKESQKVSYYKSEGSVIEKITDIFYLVKEGELLYKPHKGKEKLLKIGDSISFVIFSGASNFIYNLSFDGVGSAITSLNKERSRKIVRITNSSSAAEIETPGSTFNVSNNQFNITKKYWVADREGAISVAESFKETTNPDYNYAAFDKAVVEYIEGSAATISVTWNGFVYNERHTINLDSSPTSEPIETHEDFCNFAGTKDEPANGAIFNDDETFNKFAIYDSDGERLKFAGVTSYLAPSTTITETIEYQNATFKDLNDIGTIGDPARDDVTGISADNLADAGIRNWLCVGIEWEPIGKGCRVNKTYLLSGIGKWNKDIYS